MIVTIKKGTNKENMLAILKKIYNKTIKGVDVKKYSGKVKFETDAMLIQKELRDEWS